MTQQSPQPDRDGNKDQGGLTNRNITRPDPPQTEHLQDQQPGLEDSKVAQPAPPQTEHRQDRT